MKSSQAKELIINEYNNLVGFKMADSLKVDQYLIAGVRTKNITPTEAAKKMLKDYTDICNQSFNTQKI